MILLTCNAYKFSRAAPAPKRAAAPTAPVFIGIAPPVLEDEPPLPLPLPPVAAAASELGPMVFTDVVASGTPLVNGVPAVELAPLKAALWLVADGVGMAVAFIGFKT